MKSVNCIVILYTVLLLSCNREEIDWIMINNSFTMAENERLKVVDNDGNLLHLTVSAVTDNRCPEDEICIRKGEALVKVLIEDTRNSQHEAVLCIGDCYPAQSDLRSFTLYNKEYFLQLLDVQSYPDARHRSAKQQVLMKLFSD